MILTPHYRRVSLFNTPVKYVDHDANIDEPSRFRQRFIVGKIEYELSISLIWPYKNIYNIQFNITKVHASGQELADIVSKIMGKTVTVTHAEAINDSTYGSYGFKMAKIGNAAQVLANVGRIVQQFIDKYDPPCVTFSASEKSRADLYRRGLKRLLPAHYTVKEESSKAFTLFKACRPEKEQK